MLSRRRALFSILSLVLAAGATGAGPGLARAPGAEAKLEVGQRWRFETRPREPESTLLILRIDDDEKHGRIVHVRVENLRLKNPESPTGMSKAVAHMPFAEEALRASLRGKVADLRPIPPYEDEYEAWLAERERGRVDVYEVPVAKALDRLEQALSRRR